MLATAVACFCLDTFATPEAGTPPPVSAKPSLTCPEPEYDFGERKADEIIEHTFLLRNTGAAPLTIRRVKPSCGCTAAKLSDPVIPPGGEAKLATRLDLKGRKGDLRKSILIESTDPVQPRLRLWLQGKVVRDLELHPSFINFGAVAEDAVLTRTVELRSLQPDVYILEVSADKPYFKAELPAGTDDKPPRRFLVSTVPPLQGSLLRGNVTVTTSLEDNREVKMALVATVMAELVVIPREIVLKERMSGPVRRTIFVRPGRVKDFDILQVIPPVQGCKVKLHALPGGTRRIDIHDLPVGEAVRDTAVRIRTDVEGMETVEVPVRLVP